MVSGDRAGVGAGVGEGVIDIMPLPAFPECIDIDISLPAFPECMDIDTDPLLAPLPAFPRFFFELLEAARTVGGTVALVDVVKTLGWVAIGLVAVGLTLFQLYQRGAKRRTRSVMESNSQKANDMIAESP